MAQNSLIQVRIDETLKREADELFTDLGFDTPTAIRIFLKHAVKRHGLPFEVGHPTPNAETISAIEEVEAGRNLTGPFTNVQDLMDSLLENNDVYSA